VFIRQATGLVRNVSMLDAFVLSASSNNIGLAFIVSITWGLWAFPGANLVGGMILAAIIITVSVISTYALFSAAMPRSGGEYVFIGRTLAPSLGFAANFTNWFWQVITTGVQAVYVGSFGVAPTIAALGLLTNWQSLISLGTNASSPTGLLIIGSVTLLVFGSLLAFGLKKMLVTLDVLWIAGVIGMLGWIALLASTPQSSFVHIFDQLMAKYFAGSSNPYQQVIQIASTQGFSLNQLDPFTGLLLGTGVAFTVVSFTYWSSYVNGEVRNAGRRSTQAIAMIGSTLFTGFLAAAVLYFTIQTFGLRFLASLTYLVFVAPSALPIPIPAYVTLLVFMIARNPIIEILLGISFIGLGLTIIPTEYSMLSRSMFAWAFDRLLPIKFADVNQRWNSPTLIVITTVSLSWVALLVLSFVPVVFSAFAAVLVGMFIFMALMGVAGVMFPYVRKQWYQASSANINIVGIPLIAITGAISIPVMGWAIYVFLAYPVFGITGPLPIMVFAGLWAIAFTYYFTARYIRKRQGYDFDSIFKEIPPE
jgi:APA family basic amino acid/polyamine antiporter